MNKTRKKRAMSSKHARQVKTAGHVNEQHFADLIRCRVHKGNHQDKKDVMDQQDRAHSVKAGEYWQIFLYRKERLLNNTIFQGLGNVANIMIACIDAYPENRSKYLQNKKASKKRLQPHMRQLLEELQKPSILPAFFNKSLFDGGNADYLSIYHGKSSDAKEKKIFHVFHKDEVVNALMTHVSLQNSKARNTQQMNDQKVNLFSKLHKKNMGEIEDRHDSPKHYREMKLRFKAKLVFDILNKEIPDEKKSFPQVITHGKARQLLKKPKNSCS